MRTKGLTVYAVLITVLAVAGCGPAPDPQPLLDSLGGIKKAMLDVRSAVEARDLQAIDAVMHGKGFNAPFDKMKVAIEKAGLPTEAKGVILAAKDRLVAQLRIVHAPAHAADGSIDDIDTDAVCAAIDEALGAMEAALPAGLSLPQPTADSDGDHDSHADHDHDGHDHDGHDHDDHGHGEEGHDDHDHDAKATGGPATAGDEE
ncbi:MAG: hypothetical protein AAGB00_04490 [Planctomycetota bacterium]